MTEARRVAAVKPTKGPGRAGKARGPRRDRPPYAVLSRYYDEAYATWRTFL